MEIKEAIEQLKWYFENDDGGAAENKTKEAAYMAISALEKQEEKKLTHTDFAVLKQRLYELNERLTKILINLEPEQRQKK